MSSDAHQFEIDKKDVEKRTISKQNGHSEFLRMPFALKDACTQHYIDNILRRIQNKNYLIDIDDILVISVSQQEHMGRVRCILLCLRQSNFKIQIDVIIPE